jgi:hypothetical protein
LLRSFVTSDAVEGAVEVRLELADSLREYSPRLFWTSASLIGATCLALLAVLLHGLATIEVAWLAIDGALELDFTWWLIIAINLMLMVLIVALGATVLLFLGQNWGYIELMRARYGTLEGNGGPRSRKGSPDIEHHDARTLDRDPASTLLGLAREAEIEVPQLDKVFKYSSAFSFLLLGLMALEIALGVGGYTVLSSTWLYFVLVLLGASLVLFIVATVLLVEGQMFLKYLIARVTALEAFEAQGPVPVPEGATALDRFVSCLSQVHEMDIRYTGPGVVKGRSGKDRAFDLAMGDAGDRVLVRVFEDVPTIGDLRDLRESAEDVTQRDGKLPLRVVALVGTELDDLDVGDMEYDFLMGSQILDVDGVRGRSVQIVAEVEGHYSVLPFTVP